MANINEILARAAALRDETALNSISPERAGGIMYDTLLALNELWLQQGTALVISKIYASVAAMEADTEPVSDLTGKPLRPGQIVVIASSDSDNGSVYRYNGTESPSWSLVGSIGNIDPVDSLDSDSTTLPLAAHQGKVLDGKISQLGQEIDGIVFDGNVPISGYDIEAVVFNMQAEKIYIFTLDMENFSGTAYFGIKDRDGNTIRTMMSVTSMPFTYQYTPQQDYPGAKVILSKGGTNIFSINISVNNSIYDRLNAVNEKADNNALAIGQIANDISRIDSEIEGIQLTGRQLPISYTRTSDHYEYDATTQKIISSDNASRYVLYRYISQDGYVLLGGEISNITKTLYICKTAQVPEANVSATDVIAVNTSTFEKVVKVQAGDYLCMVVNYTYHSNFSMAVLEQSKSLILLNAKNSAPINQYDKCVADINYCAAIFAGYPGNTYGNFLASIQAGFGGLKADMRLTSDNKIILCHDPGYKLDENGDIIAYGSSEYASIVQIHDKTYAEVVALKFAEQVGGQDIYPCPLDDMLYLCKRYKSIPYLTLRSEDWASDTVDEMYYLLQKYGLVSKVIINLFPANETLCALLKDKDESLMICNTMDSTILNQDSIDNTFNLGCCVACYRRDNGSGYASQLLDQLTPEIIQYAAGKNIKLWCWNNRTEESIVDHIKAGIVGFQNYSGQPINP